MFFYRTIKHYIKTLKISHDIRNKGWNFSQNRLHSLIAEQESWVKHYLPIALKKKTVLDVGAGEGETAKLFLENGATHIIAIECSNLAYPLLEMNSKKFSITPLHKRFSLSDLNLPCDFAKFDIQGYEEALLDADPPFPCVAEIHGAQLRDKFRLKGWKIADKSQFLEDYNCTFYGYWKC